VGDKVIKKKTGERSIQDYSMLLSTKRLAKLQTKEYLNPQSSGLITPIPETANSMINSRAELEILRLNKRRGTKQLEVGEINCEESHEILTDVMIKNYSSKFKPKKSIHKLNIRKDDNFPYIRK
jgi:hypothetical protein